MSKLANSVLVLALILALGATAAPALAGDHKCSADTQTCLNMMAQQLKGRGWAGLDLDKTDDGARIKTVFENTPAQKAGFKVGDILVAIDGVRLSDVSEGEHGDLQAKMKPGSHLTYTVSRDGKERDIRVTLAAMPEETITALIGRHMLEDHAVVQVASN